MARHGIDRLRFERQGQNDQRHERHGRGEPERRLPGESVDEPTGDRCTEEKPARPGKLEDAEDPGAPGVRHPLGEIRLGGAVVRRLGETHRSEPDQGTCEHADQSSDGGPDDEEEEANDYGPSKCIYQDIEPMGEASIEMQTFYLDALEKWSLSYSMPGTDFSLRIGLNEGVGSLAGGVQPGIYPISGEDTRAEDCAVCVSIYGRNADEKLVRFMAQAGALEITEVDAANDVIHGRLVEVAMVPHDSTHIIGPSCTDHDQCGNNTCNTSLGQCYVSVPLPNHCETSIGSLTF